MDDECAGVFAALDAAYAGGWSGLQRWCRDAPASLRARHERMRVHPPPLALEVDGAIVAELDVRLGRGNNSDVYLTRDGRILKVARVASAARKLLLQAWTAPLLRAHGIAAAEVSEIDRDGLFLVQARVPGPSVRDAWRQESTLTPALRARLLGEVRRLRAFGLATGLWIDLRDRDVFVRRDGSLVHVDYGPRVHMDGSTTYAYLDAAGERRFHDDEEALARFFGRAPSVAASAAGFA